MWPRSIPRLDLRGLPLLLVLVLAPRGFSPGTQEAWRPFLSGRAKKFGQEFVKRIYKIRCILLLSSGKIHRLSMSSGALKNKPRQNSFRATSHSPSAVPGTPIFPSPQIPTFLNSNSMWIDPISGALVHGWKIEINKVIYFT